jgi:signal transduction histidine kinase
MSPDHAAPTERAADLARLTQIVYESTQALAGGTAVEQVLAAILRGIVKASGASRGAIFRRLGETCEFACELINDGGVLLSGSALHEQPFSMQLPAVWRGDPSGYFARLAAGEAQWHSVEDTEVDPIDEIPRRHAPREQRAVWDSPFSIGGRVAGYLGLNFERAVPPDDGLCQAVMTLAAQVGLALAMADLAVAAQLAAPATAQETTGRSLVKERARQDSELAAIVDRVDRGLRQSTERLAQATNVGAVIIDLLREGSKIVDSLGVIECGLLLYDPASRLLHFEAMFANGVETKLEGTPLQGPFPVDSEPLALPWRRIQQEPWLWGLTDDASILAPIAREWHESQGARSVAYLPLRRGQECIGFVGFSLQSAHPPTPQHVDLLQSVGSQVALAVGIQQLANAHEQASLAREHRRLADLRAIELTKANVALQATIDAVTDMQSLDDFMPRVVAIVARAFEAVGAGYFEHPEETIYHRFWLEDGELVAATALPDLDPTHLPVVELLARGFSVPPEHLGVGLRERLRPSIVHHRSAAVSPALHAFAVSRGWDWELNIPLFANDRTEAAITFFRHEDRPFTEADVSLAESLAKQISLARQVSRVAGREREFTVARERAAELGRANQVLRRSVDRVAEDQQIEHLVGTFLSEAVEATKAAGGAVMLRVDGAKTAFRPAAVISRGQLLDSMSIAGDPYLGRFVDLSAGDPGGLFTAMAAGITPRMSVASLRKLLPSAYEYHRARMEAMIWNAPLRIRGEILGFLALTFPDATEPSETGRETVTALATQLALALRLTEIADQQKLAAIAFERGKIAEQRAVEFARSNEALQSTIDVLTTVESLTEFVPSVLQLISVAFNSAACAYYEHLAGEPIFLKYWLWYGEVLGPEELRQHQSDSNRGFLKSLAQGFHLPANYTSEQARDGHAPIVIDHREQAAEELEIDRFYRGEGLELELRVPLIVGGRADGALVIRRTSLQPFTESEIALAGNLGKQLALATQSHRLAERARIDSLGRAQEQAVVRERERMSRDIHDTLAQGYAAILVNAQALKLSLRSELPTSVLSGIEMFERLAKENLTHARRTMEDLRADPFGRTGLAATLQQCATEETTPGLFAVAVDAPSQELWVPRYVEVELRRIVKEALHNARRHARTGRAMLKLSLAERRCTLRIIDEGVGFDSRRVQESFGIRGMRERAGRAGADFAVESSPGRGTVIALTIDAEILGG